MRVLTALLLSGLAPGVLAADAASPCHQGKAIVSVIRETGAFRIEAAGVRQDPATPLAEMPKDPGALKDWRLLAPLTRALEPMSISASLRGPLERALRANGCEVVDAHEETTVIGDSLAQYASATTGLRWRDENYDQLLIRAIPAITNDARQLVLYARVTLLRTRGMGVPEPFDLEHRSAPLPGADPEARVAALAADGARAFHAWRLAALEELVAVALHDASARDGTTVLDPRWRRSGRVELHRQGRAIVRFEGRLVAAESSPTWSPDPEHAR